MIENLNQKLDDAIENASGRVYFYLNRGSLEMAVKYEVERVFLTHKKLLESLPDSHDELHEILDNLDKGIVRTDFFAEQGCANYLKTGLTNALAMHIQTNIENEEKGDSSIHEILEQISKGNLSSRSLYNYSIILWNDYVIKMVIDSKKFKQLQRTESIKMSQFGFEATEIKLIDNQQLIISEPDFIKLTGLKGVSRFTVSIDGNSDYWIFKR